MILSAKNLQHLNSPSVILPPENAFLLPEKVLQFGTGVLLRGLPDYFIDKANRAGIFNGRVVVVKSTDTGSSNAFGEQDGLFTHAIRGIENNSKVEETFINSSINRLLTAGNEWSEILKCAHNPEMSIIISNTTEVGIQLKADDKIDHHPPQSFPGKLLSFLFERFNAFGGSEESGMVIVPTELIVDNGKKLKAIVLELAGLNALSASFISWLNEHNHFCSSLVDRIVPGKPDEKFSKQIQEELGCEDNLLIVSEVYRLWAIEGGAKVRSALSFAEADAGVVIAEDIEIFRELKLRMLNGTHTLSCGIAFLSGFPTVKTAMDDPKMSDFVTSLMLEEIAPAIPYKIADAEAKDFASKVLDRFRNPHIEHLWLAITAQFSAKLKMRVLPVLLQHYKQHTQVPERIAFGFAAYILFMKPVKKEGSSHVGNSNGNDYKITDDQAEFLAEKWEIKDINAMVSAILSSTHLWDTDLSQLPGFAKSVAEKLNLISTQGAHATLNALT